MSEAFASMPSSQHTAWTTRLSEWLFPAALGVRLPQHRAGPEAAEAPGVSLHSEPRRASTSNGEPTRRSLNMEIPLKGLWSMSRMTNMEASASLPCLHPNSLVLIQ
ncbi:uncharacterized protein [Petaurus breviceps papuanus]|uniref:uncharacterized protein isoform X2 n=1 Tax=Petaurus breviceps papuanus TaxID=3040969 RepID=UPI0036DA2149